MSSTRPIMVAGPIERNSKPRNSGSADMFGGGGCVWPPRRPCVHAGAVRQAAARRKVESCRNIVLSKGVCYTSVVTENVTQVTPAILLPVRLAGGKIRDGRNRRRRYRRRSGWPER